MKKEYIIIGFGITGLSIIKFLTAKDFSVKAIDTRTNPPNLEEVKKLLGDNYKFGKSLDYFREELLAADCVVVSPGVEIPVTLKKQLTNVIGDIELFARYVNAPVIGITGTNGKSTVTALVGEIAAKTKRVKVGGNIGTPALELLDDNAELYVLELSSFQLEIINDLELEVGCCLNIVPDHLDRHKTFEDYKKAKHRIYQLSKNIVYNLDDKDTYCDNKNSFYFSIEKASSFGFRVDRSEGCLCIFKEEQKLVALDELCVFGTHNIANILAALTISEIIGLNLNKSIEAIKQFKGLEHRCEVFAKSNGVTWINDSKGTNVGATIAAIKSASEVYSNIVLVLGGDDKGEDFSPINKVLENISAIILLGKTKNKIKSVLESYKGDILEANDLMDVVVKAANKGNCVLFSPACASFDMFDNFVRRGELFKQAVCDYQESTKVNLQR